MRDEDLFCSAALTVERQAIRRPQPPARSGIAHGWVVPINAADRERDRSAVEERRIAFVGAPQDAPAGDDVDLGDVILMPGLVNTHCHLELTAMRGFLEDLDFRRWILRLTNARRAVLDRDARWTRRAMESRKDCWPVSRRTPTRGFRRCDAGDA